MKTQPNAPKIGENAKRRRLAPEARRIELLEAAMHVLHRLGPANARVEDITEAAGAAKGTFYLYFPSWDGMLAALREHILTTYGLELRERFKGTTKATWWPAFANECLEFIRFREHLGELHKVIFHGEIVESPLEASLSAETSIGRMLEMGIKSGACRSVDISAAASLVFAVMHTTADNSVRTGERERFCLVMLEMLKSWLCVPATREK